LDVSDTLFPSPGDSSCHLFLPPQYIPASRQIKQIGGTEQAELRAEWLTASLNGVCAPGLMTGFPIALSGDKISMRQVLVAST